MKTRNFSTVDCVAAINRKKFASSLLYGGTGELVDVSASSFRWMYRSAGKVAARKSFSTSCLFLFF